MKNRISHTFIALVLVVAFLLGSLVLRPAWLPVANAQSTVPATTLPRTITVDQFLEVIARTFAQHITSELSAGFAAQGLNVYQAVTLASSLEREAVHHDEMPSISSRPSASLSRTPELDTTGSGAGAVFICV